MKFHNRYYLFSVVSFHMRKLPQSLLQQNNLTAVSCESCCMVAVVVIAIYRYFLCHLLSSFT